MATTHLYVAESGPGLGETTYHKIKNLWVWSGSAWTPVIKQSVWNGGSWQLAYDSTPGPLASIVVSPSSPTINEFTSQSFTASGFDADGRALGAVSATWTINTVTDSINSSTGTFSAGGTADSGTVHATSGSVSGSTTYSVADLGPGPLANITVSPSSATLSGGGTQTFTASGDDGHGRSVSISPTWSTTGAGDSISSGGVLTFANTTHSGSVHATQSGVTGTASYSCSFAAGPLDHITVSPNPVNVNEGDAVQFIAAGFDASGNSVSISPTWSVTGSGDSINSTGLMTAGRTVHTASVHATQGSVVGTASYTTVFTGPGPLDHIDVSPSSVTLNQGDQQQFTAQGFDASGNVVSISPTWSKSTITDSINSSGLFTAGSSSDSGTVTATSGSISGSADFTVL